MADTRKLSLSTEVPIPVERQGKRVAPSTIKMLKKMEERRLIEQQESELKSAHYVSQADPFFEFDEDLNTSSSENNNVEFPTQAMNDSDSDSNDSSRAVKNDDNDDDEEEINKELEVSVKKLDCDDLSEDIDFSLKPIPIDVIAASMQTKKQSDITVGAPSVVSRSKRQQWLRFSQEEYPQLSKSEPTPIITNGIDSPKPKRKPEIITGFKVPTLSHGVSKKQ